MSILFDPNFGAVKQSIKDIVNQKREYLKTMHNIDITDDHSSIYNIIANSLALLEVEIIDELNLFFSKLAPEGEYWTAIQNHINAKSTTHEAVKTALLNLKPVIHANILSTAGKANIYIIVDDTVLNDTKNAILDSKFKADLWEVLYYTTPSGTVLEGDILIDGFNLQGQRKEYKVSLGKRKYCYLSVKYKLDLKNYIYLEVDTQIRDIYTRICENNYKDMGISFEYQDFLAPVNEVVGIKAMNIGVYIKDDDTQNIKSISKTNFKINQDFAIGDNEILLFDIVDRLLIDIDT
ncbi:hypothetical protein CR532_05290 (plasmid) [Candidatus Borreliella tachyglossi]|uniref:DUF276 domain-containing protein n=1 Tax=Candidatus Borreliella tachyglossi TaxID=1964448 RepID=A0A2S1LYF7_9SPIR|nr:DUF276 domain-containing protein [Candidatus Borreliella tachyglossi]AWG43347.1 hypothetical protein CR532_04940 [Candidatus Borreliella tachyglossi]AWG43410.1 hypothetical protein CR532_05290 [Candidatus Borreliella tachyglossi]